MRMFTKTTIGATICTLALTLGLVPAASAATPEERAKCEEMMKSMGLGTIGTPPKSGTADTMTPQHARCKEILAQTGHTTTQHPDGKHHEGEKK